MIRTDRFCVWIFIMMFACLTFSNVIKFSDELCSFLLAGIATLDCIVNGRLGRYRLLWIIMGILFFYLAYSISFLNYNSIGAIFGDYVIQIKPYIPFVIFMAINPEFTSADKKILRYIAIFNVIYCSFFLYIYPSGITPALEYISYAGMFIFVSALVYLYTSRDEDGYVSEIDRWITVVMLVSGLGCTRSKYYGMFILALFFILAYRPGILRKLSLKRSIGLTTVAVLVIAVSWSKIEYYFIEGVKGSGDEIEILESFARPAMYAGAGMILWDHFPLGTGLASFGTIYSASPHYSKVYAEYSLDKVHGLSEDYGPFICDAFYPELAQFGIIGVILYIWFWIYVCKFLKQGIRANPDHNKYIYIAGTLCVRFLLIEGIANTTFVQATGMMTMMLLGEICSLASNKAYKPESFRSIPRKDTPVYI